MIGKSGFPNKCWTQFGVKNVVKGIPGNPKPGILIPEILAALRTGPTELSRVYLQALANGDYQKLRKMPVKNHDITSRPIKQWEFFVDNKGYSIVITASCLAVNTNEKLPAVIYFHGGGWCIGSRAQVQNAMRLLAEYSGAVVFNVEYRLAPEYRYPCATDDCWQVVRYIHANAAELGIDTNKIVVAGDSAGGNIAAACSRRNRNARTKMIWQQVLIYPVLSQIDPVYEADYHFSVNDYCIDDSQAQWIIPCINSVKMSMSGKHLYANNINEAMSADASPLLDKDYAGLPKTLIICAEYDYLTQQCKTYAKRLAAANIDVTLLVYSGTNHGFFDYIGNYPQSADAVLEFAKAFSV